MSEKHSEYPRPKCGCLPELFYPQTGRAECEHCKNVWVVHPDKEISKMNEQCCENCRFSRLTEDSSIPMLECRYNPPILNSHDVSNFPRVSKAEWCGRWEKSYE